MGIVLELEPLRGLRVVADPAALDAARWGSDGGEVSVLRLAPDDLLALGARWAEVDDEHAIVKNEAGYVGAWLSPAALEAVVARLEWPLPTARPVLAQGLIAGVAAKLWLTADGALLMTAAALASELSERLR